MKKNIFLGIIIANMSVFSQKKDLIYFDKNWKETTKENAAFFRPLPLFEVGNYQLIRDYYINGDLQMQGYTLKNDAKKYIGNIYYFDEKNIEEVSKDNDLEDVNAMLSYFYSDGKIWKKNIYKNGELNGKTTYFFKDGTIMLEGLFENGNCISGSISCDTKLNSEFRLKKGETEKQITKEIYWENSKQIAQRQTILLKKYGRELIGQQNFDKSGKLIQKLTENSFSTSSYFDEAISDGIKFEYYTRNECAVNIKSETHYSSNEKNGVLINYDLKGTIINKVIYKNNEPVEGLLEEKLSYNLLLLSNYKNSMKEGEEIVKTDKDSIIAIGIYKLGKPFSGRFLVENKYHNDTENQLQNYNNFELDGLQQVINSQNKIIESYVLKNGKKEGISTIIKDEIKSEIVYKNNVPFDGVFKDQTSETIYKNGNLISETEFRRNSPESILFKKEYENGKIVRIISFKFYIDVPQITEQKPKIVPHIVNSKPFEGFVGTYKDEKPFSGYFESVKDEFKIVDFYENGIIKFQYSKDWFATLSESENQNTGLNLKATFVDGKIVDGNEYFDYGKIKATKNWQNGVLKTLDVDFFEMHYYNRMNFQIKNEAVEISDFLYKDVKLLIDFKNDKINQRIFIKNEEISNPSLQSIDINDVLISSTLIYYSLENNQISGKSISTNQTFNEKINEYSNSLIFKDFNFLPNIIKSKNTKDLFDEIGAKFVPEDNLVEPIIRSERFDDKTSEIFAELLVNKNGKPENGVWVTKNNDNSFLLRLYSNGKLIKFKDKIALKNCSAQARKLQK